MHEVSLMAEIVALVEAEQRKQSFARVLVIRLRVGALGPAEPEALRFCFDAVVSGTVAEGARLEIQDVPGEAWCPCCRLNVPLQERFAACPECGAGGIRMTSGNELRLAELEVE